MNGKRSKENQLFHILSAIDAENKLILDSLPCKTKISEPEVFKELISVLNISRAIHTEFTKNGK